MIKCSETLLDDLADCVCRVYRKQSIDSVNKLRYDSLSQKYQGKSDQALSALDSIELSLLPPCRISLEMQAQRDNSIARPSMPRVHDDPLILVDHMN